MPRGTPWRSPTTAETFTDYEFPDFAQEFLRRNPDYQRHYRRIVRRLSDGTLTPAGASEAVRPWGLVFRLRSGFSRRR